MSYEIIIDNVEPDSPAMRSGIEPGDRLLTVNGKSPRDLIDFCLWTTCRRVTLEVMKKSGGIGRYSFRKDPWDSVGLNFSRAVFDGIKLCRARCLFCFVDQMPCSARDSLKVKDDDYRLSFLQGAYITTGNWTEADWERIDLLRLSPLYISVHATDPHIRGRLLGLKSPAPIMPQLERLRGIGIQIHAQIVVCPGINDGRVLEHTVDELVALWPAVQSVAVVPVGLTKYRTGLAPLRPLTKDEALSIILWGKRVHRACRKKYGSGLVYLADEIYLKAGCPFPERGYYEDYLQLTNGVGMLRAFLDDFRRHAVRLPRRLNKPLRLSIATGVSTRDIWPPILERLRKISGLEVDVHVVENRFFGPEVTVTGLLTGSDLCRGLKGRRLGDCVLIPEVMLRAGKGVFLDDMPLEEVRRYIEVNAIAVPACAEGLVTAVRTLTGR
ncbi:MAG: DUF512 domain-containing protein [Bacillota bacterium]